MSLVSTLITSTAAKIRARAFGAAPAKGVKTCVECAYHQICPSSLTVRS